MKRSEQHLERENFLDVELGSAPVTTLGVVLDLVVGLHAEPVRDGSVMR